MHENTYVTERRGSRDMKLADQITHPVSKAEITKEEFAKWIGMRIIEYSPILREWFKNQEKR